MYLIFSVQGSGHFQGVAKMAAAANIDEKSDIKEFTGSGMGGAFPVDWVKRYVEFPFSVQGTVDYGPIYCLLIDTHIRS